MASLKPIDMHYRVADTRFPKGWYCVADTSEVTAGEILPISFLDMQMVAYRCADGTVQVANAYCPHLGAHLASSDGCVRDGRLVCPFHKWEFDGKSGQAVHIPYSERVPRASLTLHPTRMADGKILIWYDSNGGEPDHAPYDSSEYGDPEDWILQQTSVFESTAPYIDVLENLFDTAHFQQLHRTDSTPGIKSLDATDYGLRIIYDVDPGLGTGAPLQRMEFHFTGITNVTQYFEGADWKMLVVSSHTPVDEQRFVEKVRFYISRSTPDDLRAAVATAMIGKFAAEIEQDMKVLNFKKRIERPILCVGDGPIHSYRSYARRFLA